MTDQQLLLEGTMGALRCAQSYSMSKRFGSLNVLVQFPDDWDDPDVVDVTFRGTGSMADAKIDLKWRMTEWWLVGVKGPVGVHPGFAEGAFGKSGWKLRDFIEGDLKPGSQLRISGHSKGACEALYFAMAVEAECPGLVHSVRVFACPRPGNAAFSREYMRLLGDRTKVFINDSDLITHVPPPIGWTHLPKEALVLIVGKGKIVQSPSAFQRLLAFAKACPLERLLDHQLRGYIKLLQQ